METTIFQFQKTFFTKPPKERVFVLHGEEQYLIRTFLSKLKEKYGENYTVLWGDEISEEEFYTALSETSIFGGSKEKAVVIYNFGDFLKKLGRKKKEKERLIKVLRNVKSNYVFIVYDAKLQKQELSSEPLKSVASFGGIVVANRLSKERIKQLVLKKFKEKGINVENDALEYLLQLTGYNLMELKLEVEKLIDYASEKKILTLDEVKRVAFSVSENVNVFEFVDLLLLKDYEKALKVLDSLISFGIHPLQIMKILSSYALKLYTLKRLEEKGEDLNKAMESVGIKNNFLKMKFKSYLKANSKEDLKNLILSLQRIDAFSKLYFQDTVQLLRDFLTSRLEREVVKNTSHGG
ncbi:DNA polymerase III subunit delta [Aquifex aeolicus]|uniref:Probable DNA polymerase III subunit delta n=1 Tax=Aquifex aeolicus (strain VF5) TaxID=224324 RepID=HOLA_AQUAE|nr:DNA polymerase III subunit delta [Aquifex aeolicus]O67189.1 RecName: Full=Uncharacterized protein aq_1104 [Aquifex aeolicus VF5]AAC07153.1 putative protein [Aquifex aeolicus VF5]